MRGRVEGQDAPGHGVLTRNAPQQGSPRPDEGHLPMSPPRQRLNTTNVLVVTACCQNCPAARINPDLQAQTVPGFALDPFESYPNEANKYDRGIFRQRDRSRYLPPTPRSGPGAPKSMTQRHEKSSIVPS